jgi:WD40 repeat protein
MRSHYSPCLRVLNQVTIGLLGLGAPLMTAAWPTTIAQEQVEKRQTFVKVTAAAFSPDNKYVLVGYSGGKKLLALYEVGTGKELRTFRGHRDLVIGVVFVTEARQAVSASRDGRLVLHEVATGKLLKSMPAYEGGASELTASADGRRVLTTGGNKDWFIEGEVAKMWDPEGPKLLQSFATPRFWPRGLALSPDHKWALLGCRHDATNEHVQLIDLAAGQAKHKLPASDGWSGKVAAFSLDSRLALVANSKHEGTDHMISRLALWEVTTGKVLRFLDGSGAPAAFCADKKEVVGIDFSSKSTVHVTFWDMASGKATKNVKFDLPKEAEKGQELFLSSDCRLGLLAAGGVFEGPLSFREIPRHASLRLAIWQLATGRVLSDWTRGPADQ